jgi:hypothetical protein
MIDQEQTENWTYLLLRGRRMVLASPTFAVRLLNEEDTPWFVGDSPQPNRDVNRAPFQSLTNDGLRLALPLKFIANIPEHRPCELTLEETGETAQLIFAGLRVPEYDSGWLNDLKSEPDLSPVLPPGPAPAAPPDTPPIEEHRKEPVVEPEPVVVRPPHRAWVAILIAGWIFAATATGVALYLYLFRGSQLADVEIAALKERIGILEREPARDVVAAFQDPVFLQLIMGKDQSPRGKALNEHLRQCREQAQASEAPGSASAQDPRNLDPKIAACLLSLAPRPDSRGADDLEERRFWLAAAVRSGDSRAAHLLGLSYLASGATPESGGTINVTASIKERVVAYKLFELQMAVALLAERGRNLDAATDAARRLILLVDGGAFPWMSPAARQTFKDAIAPRQ